jgi:hypothetical protein
MKHVDDFVSFPPDDEAGCYAAFCFLLFRLPAVMKIAFGKQIEQYKLFCTYQGNRYRVTGASRLGDVWLSKDFERDAGYDLRVCLEECTEWSDLPNSEGA